MNPRDEQPHWLTRDEQVAWDQYLAFLATLFRHADEPPGQVIPVRVGRNEWRRPVEHPAPKERTA